MVIQNKLLLLVGILWAIGLLIFAVGYSRPMNQQAALQAQLSDRNTSCIPDEFQSDLYSGALRVESCPSSAVR